MVVRDDRECRGQWFASDETSDHRVGRLAARHQNAQAAVPFFVQHPAGFLRVEDDRDLRRGRTVLVGKPIEKLNAGAIPRISRPALAGQAERMQQVVPVDEEKHGRPKAMARRALTLVYVMPLREWWRDMKEA